MDDAFAKRSQNMWQMYGSSSPGNEAGPYLVRYLVDSAGVWHEPEVAPDDWEHWVRELCMNYARSAKPSELWPAEEHASDAIMLELERKAEAAELSQQASKGSRRAPASAPRDADLAVRAWSTTSASVTPPSISRGRRFRSHCATPAATCSTLSCCSAGRPAQGTTRARAGNSGSRPTRAMALARRCAAS